MIIYIIYVIICIDNYICKYKYNKYKYHLIMILFYSITYFYHLPIFILKIKKKIQKTLLQNYLKYHENTSNNNYLIFLYNKKLNINLIDYLYNILNFN